MGGEKAASTRRFFVIRTSEEIMSLPSKRQPLPWAREEVEQVVAVYFQMLELELGQKSYSKKEHREALLPLLYGRSAGSVEFKLQNISAVLDDLWFPYIDGYKPRGNYQGLLFEVVEQHLRTHLQPLLALLNAVPSVPDFQGKPEDVLVPAPSISPTASAPQSNIVQSFDFARRDAANLALGQAGERWVMAYEQQRLIQAGAPELAHEVLWASREIGDGLGYDIESRTLEGEKRFIEVKTTNLTRRAPFDLTQNELLTSVKLQESYQLYRVFRFSSRPQLYSLQGDLNHLLHLMPTQYRAVPR